MTVEFKQRPLGDLIVIEMATVPRDQRILLPDWQRTLEGVVVAAGPGKPLYNGITAPMLCAVGDKVIFGAATGMESAYNGVYVRIMHDTDVDAVRRGQSDGRKRESAGEEAVLDHPQLVVSELLGTSRESGEMLSRRVRREDDPDRGAVPRGHEGPRPRWAPRAARTCGT